MQCEIKSRYLGSWEEARIGLDPSNQTLLLQRNQTKSIDLCNIVWCCLANPVQQIPCIQLATENRQYEIRGQQERLKRIVSLCKQWKKFQNFKELEEKTMRRPMALDYSRRIQQDRSESDRSMKRPKKKMRMEWEQNQGEIETEPYYRQSDWLRDTKEGGLLFINQEKKDNQPKIIKFLISQFLSKGSFMGISFPVFAMKPESMLETYVRCFSLAPKLLTEVKNPIQRIKAFNSVILTFSIRFTDLDKSFNPILGQTFQSSVCGCPIFAEQISHHPPVSAFTIVGKDFKLHGRLEVEASMGINSARGRFFGEVQVEYNDGGRIIGTVPCGILSGYLFGRYAFMPDGACYCYDPENQLLCSYGVDEKDIMRGRIGKLTHPAWRAFKALVSSDKREDLEVRCSQFQNFPQQSFEKVYSRMEVIWSKQVSYDGKVYVDYEAKEWQPPKLSRKPLNDVLPSDCRYRKDIELRKELRLDESQDEKERLEQQERAYRKLRQKFKA